MSGITNERLNLGEPVGRQVVFSTQYEDADRNSRWRIDVSGDWEAVERFKASKGLIVEAVPMTEKELTRWKEGRSERAEKLREQLARPSLIQAQQQAQEGTGEGFLDPRLPSMRIALTLLELIPQGPHRLHFVVDPDIWDREAPHAIAFDLYGADVTPDVWCTATNGSVWMSLHGGGQAWVALIYWASGAPAHYVLQGDTARF